MMKKYLFSIGVAMLAVAVFIGAGGSRFFGNDDTQGEKVQEGLPTGVEVSVKTVASETEETPIGSANITEITMLAKKWEFTPKTLTVKKGEKVRLSISSVDVDHGFALPAFNIDARLTAGASTIVEFTPEIAGTFPFTCTVYCGAGHGDMRGEVVVTE